MSIMCHTKKNIISMLYCFDNDNLSMFIADAYATWNRLLSAARIWLLARAGSSLMGAD